jgi:hypothetical protein
MAKKSEDRVLAEKCIGPDGECMSGRRQERIIQRIIKTIRRVRPVPAKDTFLEDMGG